MPFLGTGHGMGDAFHEFVALITVRDGFEKFVGGEFVLFRNSHGIIRT